MKEIDKCTPYYWCSEANIRILDLEELEEKWYFTHTVTKDEFSSWLLGKKVKPNSMPRKTSPYLEYRMYGLVPYNISSIQGAIQYGHALQEYNNLMFDAIDSIFVKPIEYVGFNKWRKEDKTFIILNGGTTNENKDDKWYGTLQQSRDILIEKKILFGEFKEPDLNNSLTAIVFLVDERVFDRETYPDYVDTPYDRFKDGKNEETIRQWEDNNNMNRAFWVDKIGGETNDWLRTWLKNFRLAN